MVSASLPESTSKNKVSPKIDPDAVRKLLKRSTSKQLILPEYDAMMMLRNAGVDCPEIGVVGSISDIERIAKTIRFPCVMKISKPAIPHKSDVGGVVVGIDSLDALLETWARMRSTLKAREAIIVEQIGEGVEVLVGCVRDETFGLRVSVGAGGIWTNFAADAVTIIPPFTNDYIRAMLPRLSIWAKLSGGRGQKKYAVDRLVASIRGVADLGWALRTELREFECNPVIVTEDRAVAVDAIGFV